MSYCDSQLMKEKKNPLGSELTTFQGLPGSSAVGSHEAVIVDNGFRSTMKEIGVQKEELLHVHTEMRWLPIKPRILLLRPPVTAW